MMLKNMERLKIFQHFLLKTICSIPIKKIIQPGQNPLVQLYNGIKEERVCFIPNYEQSIYPHLDGHYCDGLLPENLLSESVSKYSILILEKCIIRIQNLERTSSKKDDCVIMSLNIVCIIKNIVNKNGEVYFVRSTFKEIILICNSSCSSTSVGMFQYKNCHLQFNSFI